MRRSLFSIMREDAKTVDTFSDTADYGDFDEPESTDEDTDDESTEDTDSVDDSNSNTNSDEITEDAPPVEDTIPQEEKPLNVDLVYRKYELKQNNKVDSKEYVQLNNLIDKRKEEDKNNEPETNAYIPGTSDDDDKSQDIDGSPVESDDLDDETYQVDAIDNDSNNGSVSMESYSVSRLRWSQEFEYSSNAPGSVAARMAGKGLMAAGRGAGAVAGAAGHAAGALAGAAGHGVASAGRAVAPYAKQGAVAAGSFAKDKTVKGAKLGWIGLKKMFSAIGHRIAKDTSDLAKYANSFRYNVASLEKQYHKTLTELTLMTDKPKEGYYQNTKLLDKIFYKNETSLIKILDSQIKFYEELTSITLKWNTRIVKELENFTAIAAKSVDLSSDYNIKYADTAIPDIYKKTNKEYLSHDNNLDEYESEIMLMGNKKFIALFPTKSIDNFEEYLYALDEAKVILYNVPWDGIEKMSYYRKQDLIEIMNKLHGLMNTLKGSDKTIREIYGFRNKISGSLKRLSMMYSLSTLIKINKTNRVLIKDYVIDKNDFIERCYIDPYITINKLLFNDMKYVLKFVQSHLK